MPLSGDVRKSKFGVGLDQVVISRHIKAHSAEHKCRWVEKTDGSGPRRVEEK